MSLLEHAPADVFAVTQPAAAAGAANLFTADAAAARGRRPRGRRLGRRPARRARRDLGRRAAARVGRPGQRAPARAADRTTATATASTRSSSTPPGTSSWPLSSEDGLHALPWTDADDARPPATSPAPPAASWRGQVEAGHGCPITMTFAVVPALRHAPDLAADWEPLLTAAAYDPGASCPPTRRARRKAGMGMTEKQGGSDVRANTTTATPRRRRRELRRCAATSGSAARRCATSSSCSRRPPRAITCFLVPRILPDGTRNAVPHPAPQGQARQPLQRVARRSSSTATVALAGRRAGPRRADDHRDGRPHAAGLRARLGRRRCAGGTANADVARGAPQRVRPAAGRPAADAQRARRPGDRVRGRDGAGPAPRARLRRGDDDEAAPSAPGHGRGQVLGLQARARARRRGAGVPRRQRLRRGVGHAAAVPRVAAELDLGGLGQRQRARRAARAGPPAGVAGGLLRRGRPGRRRRRPARRLRGRAAGGPRATPRSSRRAPGGSSSAWRSRCRARCWSATPRPRSPTPSAPRAWPATRGWRSARCPPGTDAEAIVARHTPPPG